MKNFKLTLRCRADTGLVDIRKVVVEEDELWAALRTVLITSGYPRILLMLSEVIDSVCMHEGTDLEQEEALREAAANVIDYWKDHDKEAE